MSSFKVGIILLIIGVVLLLIGGLSYTSRANTQIGPISIEYPEEHHIPYSPLAGGVLVVTGGILMVSGRTRKQR